MTEHDHRQQPHRGDQATEERLLRRLRLIAGGVILLMIVLLVSADTLGRLFISPDFHASELILGSLLGALLLVLGIEGLNKITRSGS